VQASLEAVLDSAQQTALLHPPAAGLLALTGPAASGKTVALVRRASQLGRELPLPVLLSAPSEGGVARLRTRLAAEDGRSPLVCTTLAEVAFTLLDEERALEGREPLDRIDDVRASQHFERIGAELFALEWTEFVTAEIDPEITGLRAPERFSAAAFRLIRKLRASLISPETFKAKGLRGATAFYGRPPNFASPDLLLDTAPKYRDSLRVTPAELARQHARELDLLKILTRLYESYVGTMVAHGCLTPVDAVYEATVLARSRPDVRERARRRYAAAFIDDAQDLGPAQIGLLEALFGERLATVTLAGDGAQSTRGFAAGGRGDETLKRAATTIRFERPYRDSPDIEQAGRSILDPSERDAGAARSVPGEHVQLYRGENGRESARFVAVEIARLIAGGVPPHEVAVITRNLDCAHTYVDALLARNLPVDVAGAASLYAYPVVVDALAALWSAVDPFRHEYLSRNLEAPWLNLSDASIAILCGDAADPQALLFELPEEDDDEARAGRWDRKRDVRLGRNLTRGDVDAELPAEARERVVAFRAARARWEAAARTLPLAELARLILDESVLATLRDDARGRFESGLVARLLAGIDAYAGQEPLASLEDFLLHAEAVSGAEADLLSIELCDPGAVRVLDVEAAKGEHFDSVFLVDAQAGAWPRYYVPDAFLFMPSAGMIPKENVGDAAALRTAKFTYALSRYKLRDKYNAEERRSFYCAATRARRLLFVTASGRPTRGAAAPELYEELSRSLQNV